jgi:hypothetical protein
MQFSKRRSDTRHLIPCSSGHLGLLDAVGVAASMWAAWIMSQFVEKPPQVIVVDQIRRRATVQPMQPAIAAGAG